MAPAVNVWWNSIRWCDAIRLEIGTKTCTNHYEKRLHLRGDGGRGAVGLGVERVAVGVAVLVVVARGGRLALRAFIGRVPH